MSSTIETKTISTTLTAPGQIKSTLTIGQGPAGAGGGGPGGGDLNYVHNQGVASDTWGPIPHNLGKYPSVVAIDSAGTQCEGNVIYHDANSLSIVFSAAFGGKAYLN